MRRRAGTGRWRGARDGRTRRAGAWGTGRTAGTAAGAAKNKRKTGSVSEYAATVSTKRAIRECGRESRTSSVCAFHTSWLLYITVGAGHTAPPAGGAHSSGGAAYRGPWACGGGSRSRQRALRAALGR